LHAIRAAEHSALSVRAIVAFYREFERVTRDGDISLGQYRTMLYLKGGAQRAGAIAAASAVKRPTMSAMLNALRDNGWIVDEADPDDGRAISVALTPAGRERLARFEADLVAYLAQIVPEPDLTELHGALARAYLDLGASREARLKDMEEQYLAEEPDRSGDHKGG
jgi:DNA-binding MarR family transcriptional regulator